MRLPRRIGAHEAAPKTSALAEGAKLPRPLTAALGSVLVLLSAACGTAGPGSPGKVALRLGYFPNVTHAPAIVAIRSGILTKRLGSGTQLELKTFNAGPEAVEAIFSGALDAAWMGPNPAINAFARSKGEAIRIVAGSTSGGAFLVVKPTITSAEDLRGKKLATPQLGNTQDVALRAWLADKGLKTTKEGSGDVQILPQANAQTLQTFQSGEVDGAWVPEPWATRLIQEGGGKVLVDERDLWPDGKFVTTHLVASTKFLEQHPDVIKRVIEAQLEAEQLIETDASKAQQLVNDQVEAVTGKRLADKVMVAAWKNLTFTMDPIAPSLQRSADAAIGLGLLDPVDLSGIYDLKLLNEVLKAAGKPPVAEP
jgi:NitT/TauT family transport system substrate-binding protein